MNKKYIPSALILYLNYFIHGVGCSILGQAVIKEALAAERTKLIDELDAQDLFGDTLRWLQQRAERLDEIYSQFGEDLKNSIEDLANNGDKAVGNILKSPI